MRPTDTIKPEERIAYTLDEACLVIGLGRNSIYNLINEGTLPSRKVAGRRLILREDLLAVARGVEISHD